MEYYEFILLLISGFLYTGVGQNLSDHNPWGTLSNSTCDSGWLAYGGYCYQETQGDELLSWEEARYRCQDYGGDLASIHSIDEYQFLVDHVLKDSCGKHWIGLNSIQNTKDPTWSDGSSLDFNLLITNDDSRLLIGVVNLCTDMIGQNVNYWQYTRCTVKQKWICKKLNGNIHKPVCTSQRQSFILTLSHNDSVAIMSPNYPYPYPQHLNCTWDIESKNNTNLTIWFKDFNLISQDDVVVLSTQGQLLKWTQTLQVTWDRQIYALYLTTDTVQIQINSPKTVGDIDKEHNFTDISNDITLVDGSQGYFIRGRGKTGVEMFVMTGQDVANSSKTFDCGNGVIIHSSAICNNVDDCFNFLDETDCEFSECSRASPTSPNHRRCHIENGKLSSPGYPRQYQKDAVWTWEIRTEPNTYISLHILDFDVPSETTGSECYYTYLGFYDTIQAGLAADIEDKKRYFCHRRPPSSDPILSPFNELYVVFQTGSVTPGRGFKAEYKSVQFRTSVQLNSTTNDDRCDEGWVYFRLNCYYLRQEERNIRWIAAENSCIERGGHLASLRDIYDSEFLFEMLLRLQPVKWARMYIGLVYNESSRTHQWLDGRPLSFTDWSPYDVAGDLNAQPDNGNAGRCSMLRLETLYSTQNWHDIPCAAVLTSIYMCSKLSPKAMNTYWKETKLTTNTSIYVPPADCPGGMFQCDSDECIHSIYVCDQTVDCIDASDEEQRSCENNMDNERITEDFDYTSEPCRTGYWPCDQTNECIPATYFCDFVQDCRYGSDEHCEFPECGHDEFTCSNGQCINSKKRCDLVPDCIDKSDELNCETTSNGFLCWDETWIPAHAYCDGQTDCEGRTFEDEPIKRPGTDCVIPVSCSEDEIQCRNGVCTDTSNQCLYAFDRYGWTIGCRDQTHLLDCDDFKCPDETIKCPNSYCIGLRHRCDGTWDCPNGEDEYQCDNYTCPGLYRCHGSKSCLTLSEICDDVKHCPEGDDESYCGLQCPSGCSCSGYSFSCHGVDWSRDEADKIPFEIKHLTLVSMKETEKGDTIEDVLYLEMKEHHLLIVCDFSENGISVIQSNTFNNNKNMKSLNLARNAIRSLSNEVFMGLQSLKRLDLSGNPLVSIQQGVFGSLSQLIYLNVENHNEIDVKENVFSDLESLVVLHSHHYLVCCLARDIKTIRECLPESDLFSSCEDLMRNQFLRICMWVLGLSALLGNAFVIFWRLSPSQRRRHRKNPVQSVFVLNLAIADGLMGIYMIIIASADMYFRDVYILYESFWQKHILCKLAGFLSVLSSEASVLFLTVISVDRWLSICFPFSDVKFTKKLTGICITLIWLVTSVLSLIPLMARGYFKDQFYGRSSVCLALPLTQERPAGWQYSVALFLGLNLCAEAIIAFCYGHIYIIARSSSQSISRRSGNVRLEQIELATRMAFLIITDLICWMPIIILGFLSLFDVATISPEVYVWIAVLVLPINSSLNPYLYTILTRELRRRKSKRLEAANSQANSTALSNVNDMIDSDVFYAAIKDIRKHRILPFLEVNRHHSFTLSAYLNDPAIRFTERDINIIKDDLLRALEYLNLQKVAHVCVEPDYILIEEIEDTVQGAFLMTTNNSDKLTSTERSKTDNLSGQQTNEVNIELRPPWPVSEDTLLPYKDQVDDIMKKMSFKLVDNI